MAKTSNVTPASKPVPELFCPDSWPKNRSKFLALVTVRELQVQFHGNGGKPITLEAVYRDSSVPYHGLICGLPKWVKWKYLIKGKGIKSRIPEYRVTLKGKQFIAKLHKIIPLDVSDWLKERREWCRIRPDLPPETPRPELIRAFESLRVHRTVTRRPKPVPVPVVPPPVVPAPPTKPICDTCGSVMIGAKCEAYGLRGLYCERCGYLLAGGKKFFNLVG